MKANDLLNILKHEEAEYQRQRDRWTQEYIKAKNDPCQGTYRWICQAKADAWNDALAHLNETTDLIAHHLTHKHEYVRAHLIECAELHDGRWYDIDEQVCRFCDKARSVKHLTERGKPLPQDSCADQAVRGY